MAAKSWVLTDHSANEYVTDLTLTDKDAPAATGCTVTKRTLRGGLSDGVDVVRVDNGACRFDVLPTRGMGIWRAWVGDLEIGWRSPVRGPVHPAHVPVGESTGLGWLDGF
ncbi:MAG: DUF4432 family protein, partial [Pirellulaceae bacterium]|nr:DUF4432 family protein [Pirellulaceae bacterium]